MLLDRPRIFLSYRHDESSGHAGRLYDSLAHHFSTKNVFIDVQSIQGGTNFVDTIVENIKKSDVLLAIIGPEWISERTSTGVPDFVQLEIATAFENAVPV